MSSTEKTFTKWHKELCVVTGALAITLARRKMSKPAIKRWIIILRDIADQMATYIQ
jgi:hypothetical protein